MSVYHTPVLLEESVNLLDVQPDGTYADLTFGGGGHSRYILSKLGDGGSLYGFDRDADTRANIPDDGVSTMSRATSASCAGPCGCGA